MSETDYQRIFTPEKMASIFPSERADQFFEALFGDASEGAYDITLAYRGFDSGQRRLLFEFQLNERPGKCLACNLTYGLPEVFSRHPLLNVKEVAQKLPAEINAACREWRLGATESRSKALHVIPLAISLA